MALGPLIPYLSVPELTLIPRGFFGRFPPIDVSIKPFGVLVTIGVYLGAWLAVRQGKRVGLEERTLVSFIFWVVLTGFVLGHVLDIVLYFPERIAGDPLSLIRLWDGLSSFGGFVGAIVGALLFKWRHKVKILPYADVVASAFPVGWVFGRAGCSLAHDHPGIHSDAWFAVAYPGGGRFDLGLYEMLLTIPLAIAFLFLRRRPRPWGFYAGTMCVAYAPTRFALDFLRVRDTASADVRYAALTPAQWACFALLAFGAALLWNALARENPANRALPATP
jgi:phosphatidylglycerol---prolipoprotein diacylglyceryl transferase